MKKKKLLLSALVGIVLTSNAFTQLPSYVPTNGLVAWYPFNGNTNDESGNGHNGEVIGGSAQFFTDRDGNLNSSYSLQGTYVKVPDHDALSFTDRNFTIAFWSYHNTTFPDNRKFLISKDMTSTGMNNSEYFIGRQTYDDAATDFTPKSLIVCIGSDVNAVFTGTLEEGPVCENEIWDHFVITGAGDYLIVYKNGVYIEDGFWNSGNMQNGLGDLFFGKGGYYSYYDTYTSGTTANTKLDDIGIWNRPLSDVEVTNLKNSIDVASISELENGFKLSPNPSSDILNISIESYEGDFEIFDLMGKSLIKTNNKSIDISNLYPGQYIIKCKGSIQKFVKL